MSEIKIVVHQNIESIIDEIVLIEKLVFDKPYSKEKILKEAGVRGSLLVLGAEVNQIFVGYKIGYPLTGKKFYSWIGAVHPDYRKKGIASKLMNKQHELMYQMKFDTVRTNTENKYKEMLILNLKSGFEIIGTCKSLGSESLTIQLEKRLT